MRKIFEIIILLSILSSILITLKYAHGQGFFGDFNQTTGNYISDPNNPNNAENKILQYCIDHADRVASGDNVVNDLVVTGLVPSFYNGMTCIDVQNFHKQNLFNAEIQKGVDAVSRAFGID